MARAKYISNVRDVENVENEELIIYNHETRGIKFPPTLGSIILFPGENNISSDVWERAKENPTISMYIEMNYLENKGAGVARPILESLDGVSFGEAKVFIAQERSKDQLEKWANNSESEILEKLCREKLKKV